MATTFQKISKVAQTAISAAHHFVEGNDGGFDQDDLDQFLSFSFEEYGYGEEFRGLYDDTLSACAYTYQQIESPEDEEE